MTDPSQFVPLSALVNNDPGTVEMSETSRRRFVALMAGSLALAGLTGCTRQPTETILPYVDPPENAIPGRPKYYATAIPSPGGAEGVIVESHLGRPTKVEGNPDHPANVGATSVHAQASLMDLYDPDRAQAITKLGEQRSWEEFIGELDSTLAPLRASKGEGLSILTGWVLSPSLAAQIDQVRKAFPAAKWHAYDACGPHSARAGAQLAFGKPVNTWYDFSKAAVVLSLDADFLASEPGSTRYARDYSVRRRQGNRMDMNRLYVVETTMTATGGKAEHRLPVRYRDVEEFARSLHQRVTGGLPAAHIHWVETVAADLEAHRGACVVIAGEHQSPQVHALAHAINAALGNVGQTVFYTQPVEANPMDQIASLRELTGDLNAGKVQLLLLLGGNPVYNAPADFRFRDALLKAHRSIHVSLHRDETSQYTTWHIPESHPLEDWGDTRAFDGTVSIIQPLIAPLYDSRSYLTILDALLQFPGRTSYEIVRATWQKQPDFENWWRKSVHDGLVAGSAFPTIDPGKPNVAPPTSDVLNEGLDLVLRPDVYMRDGRFANNIWLQELPRPMTKLTWDNAIYVSPHTAGALGLQAQKVAELTFGGATVEGSVWILPGQPDSVIGVDLGYGRWRSGRAGNGAGFNAYPLRQSGALWGGRGAKVRNTGKAYPLATTQMQQAMEHRDIVVSNTLEGFRRDPDFVKNKVHEPKPNDTLYPHWDCRGYAWAMSIDLTACVNCQACVVACQAENNIPVVGKDQVLARRAMHWLRIDVYYEDGYESPAARYAPIPCMQCEDAPCELVCPTQATNHSADGLNDMVYNRCVGTRYCSNNCPYKVRRFNFLLFQDWTTEQLKMQRNPDVTVRSRGVMEKCTYCVQRIREAEIAAQNEDRPLHDGEIVTACQQACPTQAIVFGDKNNSGNQVAKLKALPLNYSMLADLNTRPRTTYLAELRNPNPALPQGTSS